MKQRRIREAAKCYIVANQDTAADKNVMFKVVEILIRETDDRFMEGAGR